MGHIKFENLEKYFLCCVNIGMGATLANYANNGIREKYGDFFGTFFSLIKTLRRFKPIDLNINGKVYKNIYNLSIGKTYYVASGLKIKNNCAPCDHRLYMLSIKNKLIRSMIKMYLGMKFKLLYTEVIEIKGECAVEFDGDEGGCLPCSITTAEEIEVFCP